jgi:hypothetical protein
MAIVNITVSNDADFYQAFQYMTTLGEPVDLTLVSSMWMMLRRHAEDEAAVLRIDTETGGIVVYDAPNGKFSVRIAQDVLERLDVGDYDHSLIAEMMLYKRCIWTGILTNNAGPSR